MLAYWIRMVRAERFELPTFWFVARRSIQLSYARMRNPDRLPNRVKNSKFTGHRGGILHLKSGMARPYWSGQISLSLVSFAVEIYPATTSARQFQFHQIDRATGQRIHYQNVVADGDEQEEPDTHHKAGRLHVAASAHKEEEPHVVDKSEIVKGYEYEKG